MKYLIILLLLAGCSMPVDKFIVDSWAIEDVNSGIVGTISFYNNGTVMDNQQILTSSQEYEVDGTMIHFTKDRKYIQMIDKESNAFKGLSGQNTYYLFKRMDSLDKDECAGDDDCESTQNCISMKCSDMTCKTTVIDHVCVECTAKSDCNQNEICTDNKCILLECLDDDDCRDDERCTDNKCTDIVCLNDSDCKSGYSCESHECKKFQCVNDFDCKIDEVCKKHECVLIKCSKDTDCRGDTICVDSACVAPDCVKDSDCLDNETCKDHECTYVEVELGIDRVVVAPDSNLDLGDTFEVSIYLTKKADFVAYLEIPSFDVMNVEVVENSKEQRFLSRVPSKSSTGDYTVIAKVNADGEFYRVEKTISVDAS